MTETRTKTINVDLELHALLKELAESEKLRLDRPRLSLNDLTYEMYKHYIKTAVL